MESQHEDTDAEDSNECAQLAAADVSENSHDPMLQADRAAVALNYFRRAP